MNCFKSREDLSEAALQRAEEILAGGGQGREITHGDSFRHSGTDN